MRKDGDRPIIEPLRSHSLVALLATLEPMEETLTPIDDPLPEPVPLGCTRISLGRST